MKIKLISRNIKGLFIFHRFIYFKTFDFALAFEIFVSVCYELLRPRYLVVYRCQMFFLNIQSIVYNCRGYESLGIKYQSYDSYDAQKWGSLKYIPCIGCSFLLFLKSRNDRWNG